MATTVQTTDLVDYWQDAATKNLPTYTELTSNGFAQDGDPVTGQRATLPGAPWFNLIAAMRVSLIKAAGLTPSQTPDPLQFLTALQSMAWMQDKKIATAMLADSLVTAVKLASNAVETAKIKDAAVTAAKLAANSVETGKIKDAAVTNAKIAAGVLTFDRLASAAIATQEQAIAGTENDVLMTPQRVAQAIDELLPPSIPTGALMFFHATTPPEGWLLCNGQGVSRTTYANLFAVIGTKYGSGDGSTTFNLPNLHHRFLEGTTTSSEVGQSVSAGLPNITGYTSGLLFGSESEFVGAFLRQGESVNAKDPTGSWNHRYQTVGLDGSRVASVFGKASSVQPPAIRVLPCIKI